MVTPDLSELLQAGAPYLSELSVGIIIAIMVLLFLALLSIIGYFPVLLSLTSYTSVVARIKARGVPFIEEEKLWDLMQSGSVPDCITRLKNAGYLADVTHECSNEQLEEEIISSWYEEVVSLRSEAPRDAWMFFDAYLFFHETEKMKRIIRLVHAKQGDRISENPHLWPVDITPELAMRIANAQSVGECVRFLQETRFGEILLRALPGYEKEGSLFYLEHVLDCEGYAELARQTLMVQSTLAAPYRDFTSYLIDIQNIRTLLRAKHAGWEAGSVILCLVSGGLNLPSWRLTQLNEMMSLPDLVRQLSGTIFDKPLTPLLRTYPSSDSMMQMDLALDRLLLETAYRLGMEYYHSGGPLLLYLVQKEFELRNIRIIIACLREGMKPDAISGLLVTGQEAS